jgi:hypothetical protein
LNSDDHVLTASSCDPTSNILEGMDETSEPARVGCRHAMRIPSGTSCDGRTSFDNDDADAVAAPTSRCESGAFDVVDDDDADADEDDKDEDDDENNAADAVAVVDEYDDEPENDAVTAAWKKNMRQWKRLKNIYNVTLASRGRL